jgi:DNA-binding NtrC family response regulator
MFLTVILAVGLDPWQLTTQGPRWKSEGYISIAVTSIREAIKHFKAGDFDLVLLGQSISPEDKERLTYLIRTSGAQTPVVCIADPSGVSFSFADATLANEGNILCAGMGELLAKRANMRAQQSLFIRNIA